jgi:hypothetical protein
MFIILQKGLFATMAHAPKMLVANAVGPTLTEA